MKFYVLKDNLYATDDRLSSWSANVSNAHEFGALTAASMMTKMVSMRVSGKLTAKSFRIEIVPDTVAELAYEKE